MDSPAAHDYQVAALLGRVPLFLGSAIAMTYFPQVASATSEVVARLHQARAVRLMFVLGIPIAALLATTPNWALEILAPGRGAHVAHLLPLTGITGTTVAMATVLACAHQADQRYGRLLLRLVPLVVMEPLVLIIAGDLGTSTSFALCAAATGVVTVGVLVADIRSWRPWAVLRRSDVGGVLIVVTLAVVGGAVPLVWWIALVATLTVFARALLGGSAERHDLDVHDRGAR